jgi:hypothetical protein
MVRLCNPICRDQRRNTEHNLATRPGPLQGLKVVCLTFKLQDQILGECYHWHCRHRCLCGQRGEVSVEEGLYDDSFNIRPSPSYFFLNFTSKISPELNTKYSISQRQRLLSFRTQFFLLGTQNRPPPTIVAAAAGPTPISALVQSYILITAGPHFSLTNCNHISVVSLTL